jgi:sialate O-acetylesterase
VPQIDHVDSDGAAHPADQAEGTWEPLTAETLGDVSAVGYHALQRLHQEHPDTVFAIVDCFKGGTSATCWVPREKLDDQRLREAYVEPFDVAIAGKSEEDFNREERIYDESVERHNTELSSFQEAHPECSVSEAKDVVGHTPWPPPARPTSPFRPCGLYETMFGTVSALAFTAVVWYQGEDDTGHSNLYRILLERLISSWREALGDAALTFYVIQLPGYADGIDDSWAEVREAQLRVCEGDPHAFLVSIADTGEEHNIHPTSKKVAGTRLGTILGDELEHGTPVVSDVHDRGRDVIIDIRDSEGILAGETSTNAKGRGADGVWKPISILTETSSPQLVIERGVDCSAIRYGYENYPRLSIYDESGMPLAPFSLVRTQGEWKLE